MTPLHGIHGIPWQDLKLQHRYPHMMSQDQQVWDAALAAGIITYPRVAYDLHVGEPVQPTAPLDPLLRQISLGVTRKRIDVVGDGPNAYDVIEIKPYGNHAALGQALLYADLFRNEFHPPKPVRPVILCAAIDPDVQPIADRFNVIMIAVHVPDLVTPGEFHTASVPSGSQTPQASRPDLLSDHWDSSEPPTSETTGSGSP